MTNLSNFQLKKICPEKFICLTEIFGSNFKNSEIPKRNRSKKFVFRYPQLRQIWIQRLFSSYQMRKFYVFEAQISSLREKLSR